MFRQAGHTPPHQRFARRDENLLDREPVWSFDTIELNVGVVHMEVEFFEETGELRTEKVIKCTT